MYFSFTNHEMCILFPGGWGGGGCTHSEKGYQLRSDCWRAVAVTTCTSLKKGTVLLLYCRIGELSESVQLIFHINLMYEFKCVRNSS